MAKHIKKTGHKQKSPIEKKFNLMPLTRQQEVRREFKSGYTTVEDLAKQYNTSVADIEKIISSKSDWNDIEIRLK